MVRREDCIEGQIRIFFPYSKDIIQELVWLFLRLVLLLITDVYHYWLRCPHIQIWWFWQGSLSVHDPFTLGFWIFMCSHFFTSFLLTLWYPLDLASAYIYPLIPYNILCICVLCIARMGSDVVRNPLALYAWVWTPASICEFAHPIWERNVEKYTFRKFSQIFSSACMQTKLYTAKRTRTKIIPWLKTITTREIEKPDLRAKV